MRKFLLTIVWLLVIAVVVLMGLAAARPGNYHVERHGTIGAPPATVFALVNDLHRWPEWSPWEKLDPAMKRTFDGPPSGVNSSYAWSGNDKVGEGKMTITGSEPDSVVRLRLEFIKPWTATDQVTLRFVPSGAGTEMTWAMDGTNNFVARVFTVFMNMDQMIGKDFESGISNLKSLSEGAPAPSDSTAAGKS